MCFTVRMNDTPLILTVEVSRLRPIAFVTFNNIVQANILGPTNHLEYVHGKVQSQTDYVLVIRAQLFKASLA